jgi:hypothetical protein
MSRHLLQGCQIVCFQTKNLNFGRFWRVLLRRDLGIFYDHLVYFTAIGNILRPFGIFCGILVFFPCFGFWTKKNLATLICCD